MGDYHFSLGAHLLLWVFPTVLAAGAIALHVLTSGEEERLEGGPPDEAADRPRERR